MPDFCLDNTKKKASSFLLRLPTPPLQVKIKFYERNKTSLASACFDPVIKASSLLALWQARIFSQLFFFFFFFFVCVCVLEKVAYALIVLCIWLNRRYILQTILLYSDQAVKNRYRHLTINPINFLFFTNHLIIRTHTRITDPSLLLAESSSIPYQKS